MITTGICCCFDVFISYLYTKGELASQQPGLKWLESNSLPSYGEGIFMLVSLLIWGDAHFYAVHRTLHEVRCLCQTSNPVACLYTPCRDLIQLVETPGSNPDLILYQVPFLYKNVHKVAATPYWAPSPTRAINPRHQPEPSPRAINPSHQPALQQ